jgi:hypothetical protein
MPVQTWISGQVLTAAEMTTLTQMMPYPSAISASITNTPYAVPGTLYLVTTSTNAITIDLPTPVSGATIGVKKVDAAAGTITISTAATSGYILGPGVPANATSIQCSAYGAYVELQADGTNWHIVGGQQDSGWIALTSLFANSWASVAGPATGNTVAGYRITGNVVRLGGRIGTGASNTQAFTLPAGYRPLYLVEFPGITTVTTISAGLVLITPAGACTVNNGAGTIPQLDGITFTVD